MKITNPNYSRGKAIGVLVVAAILLLSACAQQAPTAEAPTSLPPTAPPPPTEAAPVVAPTQVSPTEVPTAEPTVEKAAGGDAAKGVAYMKQTCTMCHGVPDPGTIKPYNAETGRAFLAGHMINSSDESLDNMIAYFFPADEAVTQASATETKVVGDAAKGVAYMKQTCTMCHGVPDPGTIKPFNAVTGRAFLAGHMINSTDEALDNMIAYFFPPEE
ncbi:MAG TPA: hypothetical protein PKD55_09295 [Bellilinea sp.]|nr:hypothetical protein [Bellilinea sp.]